MRRPILVTGSHRSGTTWVGRMLCLSGDAGYIHEPFNPSRSPGWFPQPLPYWFMYICPENEAPYCPRVEEMLRWRYPVVDALKASRGPKEIARQLPEIGRSVVSRSRNLRPLLKDPMALFSAEWLADRFDAEVVVMVRHPAAFVGSIKRLNWGFDYERNWLEQDLLMRDHLARYADRFKGYQGEVDIVGEGIVIWNAMYDVVSTYRERHPDWTYVKYEELAEEPVAGFRAIYERMGLRWNERVEQRISAYASPENPEEVAPWRRRAIKRDSRAAKSTWRRRLTQQEVDRIRAGVADVARRFYDESDWEQA